MDGCGLYETYERDAIFLNKKCSTFRIKLKWVAINQIVDELIGFQFIIDVGFHGYLLSLWVVNFEFYGQPFRVFLPQVIGHNWSNVHEFNPTFQLYILC